MATGAIPPSPKSNRGSSSAGLAALLAAAAVGGGIYYVSHRPPPRPVNNHDTLPQVEALARAEKDTEWLQRAIRERQAILGMTYREVEMAKGRPHLKQRGDTLTDTQRAKGGAENWVYALDGGEVSEVLFGANGVVIHATDVTGKPRYGHAIRQ